MNVLMTYENGWFIVLCAIAVVLISVAYRTFRSGSW